MARQKSVILSSTDKKNIASDLKATIRTTKAEVATLLRAAKVAEKEHDKAMRDFDKQITAANNKLAALEAELTTVSSPAG